MGINKRIIVQVTFTYHGEASTVRDEIEGYLFNVATLVFEMSRLARRDNTGGCSRRRVRVGGAREPLTAGGGAGKQGEGERAREIERAGSGWLCGGRCIIKLRALHLIVLK